MISSLINTADVYQNVYSLCVCAGCCLAMPPPACCVLCHPDEILYRVSVSINVHKQVNSM